MVGEAFHCFQLFCLEGTGTAQHFVEVHLMSVELGTIDAHEACLATNGDAAGTTHTRTVNHDGVQGYISGNFVFLG